PQLVLPLATWPPLRTFNIAPATAANRLRDFIAESSLPPFIASSQRTKKMDRIIVENFAFFPRRQIAALKNAAGSVFPPLAVGKVGRKKDLVFAEESDLLREHWVIGFRR